MIYQSNRYDIRGNFINFIIAVLNELIKRIGNKNLTIKIPKSGKEGIPLKNGHMHNNAEIFVQLEGTTNFKFYNEVITLMPDELCIVPTILAHSEKGETIKGKFTNLVIMIEKKTLSFHIGKLNRDNMPYIYHIEGSAVPEDWNFFDYVMDICKYTWRDYQESIEASHSLLKSLLHIMLVFVKENAPFHFSPNEKIEKCKRIIFCNIHDYKLSVKFIAHQLNLSPDYLSNYYKKKTGESLIDYINRRRLEKAVYFLENSTMNVSEISYECGYRNPGYFTRLFKRKFDKTPKEYRNEL
ncbi:MAG: helix-turn-helix transcriptional regulator [Spirochaetales bacterium]|nr:helix-turn-helix transcriptional regulator [Spirochaetales bacterium]